MLLFGHTGITLGVAWVARGLARRASPFDRLLRHAQDGVRTAPGAIAPSRRLPYPALLAGSLLPDIVDKLGYLVFRDLFTASRTIGHSLVFSLVLLLAGWLLHRRGTSWLIVLSLASLGHLVLDEMWQQLGTLFWPLLGWGFDRLELEEWFPTLWLRLGNIKVLVPELVGVAIILALVVGGLWAHRARVGPGERS